VITQRVTLSKHSTVASDGGDEKNHLNSGNPTTTSLKPLEGKDKQTAEVGVPRAGQT
jgi:hypothetical protein